MSLEAYAQQISDFVREHEAWAPPIVFALAFGESLAFISLLVPAWAALVAIGALVGVSGIEFWPIWFAASIGAALGDWLSYWIGLKLEKAVYHDARNFRACHQFSAHARYSLVTKPDRESNLYIRLLRISP